MIYTTVVYPNMILSIYTMVVYIMYVVYIHDRYVLLNLGQQVRKFFGVFFRVFFYKLIQYVPRIFFKYIINFINVKEFKFPSFRIVKHLRVAKAVNFIYKNVNWICYCI